MGTILKDTKLIRNKFDKDFFFFLVSLISDLLFQNNWVDSTETYRPLSNYTYMPIIKHDDICLPASYVFYRNSHL